MPIISCITLGAGAIIRFFGPESIGGAGDIGAKTDAEVARTGLPSDEVGPKVKVSYYASRRNYMILLSKDILPYGRETHSDSWTSCNVRLRVFSSKGMAIIIELTEPISIELMDNKVSYVSRVALVPINKFILGGGYT